MNRRTFLTLPLLGFCSSVAKPVYGGMDLAGTVHRGEIIVPALSYWIGEGVPIRIGVRVTDSE